MEASGERLSYQGQLDSVRKELPDLVEHIYIVTLLDYPGIATLMLAKPEGEAGPKDGVRIFVNPYTGEIQGVQGYKDSIMGKVYHFHRTLYLGSWGKWVTSTSALLLACSVLAGFLVWCSQKRHRNKREGLLYYLHLKLGALFAPVIFLISLNGLFVTYRFVMIPLFYLVTGSEIPTKMFEQVKLDPQPTEKRLSLDRLIEIAEEVTPTASNGVMLEPTDPIHPVTVIRRKPGEPREAGGTFVDINPYTGEILDVMDFTEGSLGARLTYFSIHLHTGEWGGYFGDRMKLITRILWCLSAFVAVILGFSGLWSFCRKKNRFIC